MPTPGTRSDFITCIRQETRALLKAIDNLAALHRQWERGMHTWLQDGDFVGENEGLTRGDINSVFTTLKAIEDLLSTGHGMHLERVR